MLFRVVPTALVLLLAAPAAALACPVCGTFGSADNAWAYTAMTVVLSGLPLAMIGGVVFWVYKRESAGTAEAGDAAPGRRGQREEGTD